MVLSAVIDPRFQPSKFLDEEQIEKVKIELVRRMEAIESEESQVVIVEEEPDLPSKKKTAMDILLGEEEEEVSS